MKRNIVVINLILLALLTAGDVCYIIYGGLWLKSLTSAVFVAVGLVNLVYHLITRSENRNFAIFLFVGLVFAMLGDIVINLHFISGALVFGIGHVFFFVSYCFLSKFSWRDLICSACIFIPSVLIITLVPIFDFGGVVMEVVCIIYALIISLMVGKAISNVIKKKSLTEIFILCGSVLFFISDFMLLLNKFASLGKITTILCLATYYPAEFLLAFSIFVCAVVGNKKENKNLQVEKEEK